MLHASGRKSHCMEFQGYIPKMPWFLWIPFENFSCAGSIGGHQLAEALGFHLFPFFHLFSYKSKGFFSWGVWVYSLLCMLQIKLIISDASHSHALGACICKVYTVKDSTFGGKTGAQRPVEIPSIKYRISLSNKLILKHPGLVLVFPSLVFFSAGWRL